MKIILTKSCGYSSESPGWVLLDEYPYARVSVDFHCFFHCFVLVKLATSSEGLIELKQYYEIAMTVWLRMVNRWISSLSQLTLLLVMSAIQRRRRAGVEPRIRINTTRKLINSLISKIIQHVNSCELFVITLCLTIVLALLGRVQKCATGLWNVPVFT